MIVQADGAALCLGRFRNGFDPFRLGGDSLSLLVRIARWLASAHDPQLRLDAMPPENVQDQARFVVECCRKPPTEQVNVALSDNTQRRSALYPGRSDAASHQI